MNRGHVVLLLLLLHRRVHVPRTTTAVVAMVLVVARVPQGAVVVPAWRQLRQAVLPWVGHEASKTRQHHKKTFNPLSTGNAFGEDFGDT